jgi:DNA-binding NarL/FixJ family response regulator
MIRVLIADDHTILREGLKQILSDHDDLLVTGEAENGTEALHKIQAGDFDVVVLDMSMPGRSGIELIKQIREEKPKLPILILSMHKEDLYAVRTLKVGASGYLSKDSASTQLVDAIRKVASGGLFISPIVAEKMALGLRQPEVALPHSSLSDREYQVFLMLVHGNSITDIAKELNLSVKTVSTHKSRIQEKIGLDNLSGLVKYAIRHQLIEETDDD